MTEYCKVQSCVNAQMQDSYYCHAHRYEYEELKPRPIKTEVVNDHIKVNIEQTSKGARVTVTYDRSDHSIDEAVLGAINTYEQTIEELKQRGMKVDEA